MIYQVFLNLQAAGMRRRCALANENDLNFSFPEVANQCIRSHHQRTYG
jgi:hypothetical protein